MERTNVSIPPNAVATTVDPISDIRANDPTAEALNLRTKLEEPRVSDAAQHAADLNSMIFIAGFLAIVVVGELLGSRTTLQRCAALFGIVLIAAVAVRLTTPTMQPGIALDRTQTERAA